MSRRISRRRFIKRSAASVAAVTAVSRKAARAQANDRLQLAFIGTGGRGGANLKALTKDGDVDVVALCDVNSKNLDSAAQKFPKARTYADFRNLYDKIDDIDAVVVSTCEHTHAYATMPALKNNKHVYCEKPLTHNVFESRLIQLEAERAGVATQMGTQIHANGNYRRVVELVQSGAIGNVSECHVWVGRAWGLQSEEDSKAHKDRVYVTEKPKEAQTAPGHLNWDLWLGPAPYRPYNEIYFPGPKWYRWWDFGNGTMSDLGSHWNDLPFWALKLDAPTSIQAFGPDPHPEIAPASMSAKYEYPARGERPALTLTWHQGTAKPQIWKDKAIPQWNSGVLFIGDKGMLLSDYGKHKLLPEDKFTDFEPPEKFIADSPGHHREWLNACLTGSETGSPFSYAGPLTEANHLGNVAFRAGTKLNWDAANLTVTNNADAIRFLKRDPRAGWML